MVDGIDDSLFCESLDGWAKEGKVPKLAGEGVRLNNPCEG